MFEYSEQNNIFKSFLIFGFVFGMPPSEFLFLIVFSF
jgi:hypothetical protein